MRAARRLASVATLGMLAVVAWAVLAAPQAGRPSRPTERIEQSSLAASPGQAISRVRSARDVPTPERHQVLAAFFGSVLALALSLQRRPGPTPDPCPSSSGAASLGARAPPRSRT